ncbi:uncharacterized protein LOC106755443 isoform X3 [Vigna radiata var. radiata]|uniref:Uncharacterized protein LOC106755443 isoform X3 n=1 Tax=Vigna radiata var. radiata TaxID=3916 RepID=A0A1S3TH51_VIGRR|nr:uncharacterized protein LOC106755443 isoform X3 [Vigna radiata var. radiata]
MVFFQYLTGQCAGNLKIRILVVPQPLGLILSDWEYILPMLILGAGLSHCGVSIWTGYAPKTPEKDIPSRLLDEEKYAKEASGSGGHILMITKSQRRKIKEMEEIQANMGKTNFGEAEWKP